MPSALPRFTSLTLILTEQCNLRCSYCYVPKSQRTMPEGLALRATDLLVDRAPAETPLSLSFFGGEPFLARELMARAMSRARDRAGARIRFTAPTNGTLLDDAALALVRDHDLRLALSLDGAAASADRPNGRGEGSLERMRPLLPRLAGMKPILRMTVTPGNVAGLADNVIALHGWGFDRIMHQPALEEPWPADAVERWVAEHRRLTDWLCDRHAAREPIPELVTLEGISRRLSGQAPGSCGAGVSQAAVDVEGRLFGCFRSAYDPRAERLVLGRIGEERVNETLIASYARLHASRALPERGSCASCDARAGCTCYCPAMGHVLLGDLRAVSERACALMRPQVAIVEEAMTHMARADRTRTRRVVGHVAAAALALGLGASSVACGDRATGPADAGVKDSRVGFEGAGLCAIDFRRGEPIAGLCPPPLPDGLIGGVCPYLPDQGVKKDGPIKKDAPPIGPGLCPIAPDGLAPGLCPAPAPDLAKPKLDGAGPGPGLCPVPGLC
jgi:uncharacterized protein